MQCGEWDLWIFGVPYSLAISEPFWYKSEYPLSLKKFFLFNLHDILSGASPSFIIGSHKSKSQKKGAA